ncbi:MAG TPA: hypothetical protein VGO47_02785 [Chlamydiales bacterium]|nr:hypothetical protein [Chlamydiales bacterium]
MKLLTSSAGTADDASSARPGMHMGDVRPAKLTSTFEYVGELRIFVYLGRLGLAQVPPAYKNLPNLILIESHRNNLRNHSFDLINYTETCMIIKNDSRKKQRTGMIIKMIAEKKAADSRKKGSRQATRNAMRAEEHMLTSKSMK